MDTMTILCKHDDLVPEWAVMYTDREELIRQAFDTLTTSGGWKYRLQNHTGTIAEKA